ncbi:MAG: winged helix-turn-helix domain-containing protein [Phycisphaerales bacterium]
MEAEQIADLLGSNRRTVQEWCYRYRDHGRDRLIPIKPPGNKPLLPPEQEEVFRRRITQGPREEDGVCTVRAKEARFILEQEFSVAHQLKSVHDLIHRLGLTCLKPRPRHEKSDPEAMRRLCEETAPLSSARASKRSSPRPASAGRSSRRK